MLSGLYEYAKKLIFNQLMVAQFGRVLPAHKQSAIVREVLKLHQRTADLEGLNINPTSMLTELDENSPKDLLERRARDVLAGLNRLTAHSGERSEASLRTRQVIAGLRNYNNVSRNCSKYDEITFYCDVDDQVV